MMHVGNEVAKFVKKIAEEGFNGIQVDHIEYECLWTSQYAMFILDFDLYDVGQYFDHAEFDRDFQQEVKETFPTCKCTLHAGTNEWEIVGPDYDKLHTDANKEKMDIYSEEHDDEHSRDEPSFWKEESAVFH